MSGRHLDPERGDGLQLVRLIGSIIAIGLALFLILWAFTGDDPDDTAAATTTNDATDTSASADTTGESPATSEGVPSTSVPATTTPPSTGAPTTTAATTTTGQTTTTITGRPPGEVTVVVLNAEGTAGLAGDTSEMLAELGYQMGPADDFGELIETSRVVHAPDFGAEAFVIAEEFPDAEVSEDAAVAEQWGADVVVVLGSSYEP